MCVIERSPVIETRRLALRAPDMSDAPRIASLGADYAIPKMTTRMPWPYGQADAEEFVARVQAQDWSRNATFAIELEDAGVIGVLGFFPNEDGRLEVGYWIGRPFWGRGLATEALQGALSWAAHDWRRKLVVAGHFADNPASGQVLVKAGFLYTGVVTEKDSVSRGASVATRMMVWLA
ncbi:GNAT family N-acetyltransferase [Caulobacter sp. 602-2]|uniref:GNAT family N-acetyltransferase n=1 Tax=Caulobacter sp. 602-2 TaxID=2710887 RepID=A0A6G4R0P7_9CAUL|nr:GNAT family N-acetyltransferase [Caulobacter sp. 602-2]NGM51287.1 GNAT family N-acetyltransferase [Caulobacter sp. 602-2]